MFNRRGWMKPAHSCHQLYCAPKEGKLMEVFAELAINVLASVILLGFGFFGGKYRERGLQQGRNLEEYDFNYLPAR
jgi:hypothetical protein